MTVAQATTKLHSRSCRVGTVTRVHSTARRKGKVVRESPAPGRRLGHLAKVNLWLGRGR